MCDQSDLRSRPLHLTSIQSAENKQKMLCVTLDDREHGLRRVFALRVEGRSDIRMECRRLDMGDVLIEKTISGPNNALVREGPIIVVERKQVMDLMSSLFDGRLAEQCSRMRQYQLEQTAGEVWTVIVVEGVASMENFRNQDPDAKFRHGQGHIIQCDMFLTFLSKRTSS